MAKKPVKPKGRHGDDHWGGITPPVLASRICKPKGKILHKPGKSRKHGVKSTITIDQIQGETKALGQWLSHLSKVMASVRPANQVLVELPAWSGGTPPPPPMVGRLCKTEGLLQIRARDLAQLLDALKKETAAITRHLGRLETGAGRRPPTRPAPR